MAHRSLIPTMRAFALGALLLTSACTADEAEKSGYDGEFCVKDNDCRSAHICNAGVCESLNASTSTECTSLCDKLEGCDRTERDCVARCIQTVTDWSEIALASFADCTLNELTCADAQDGQAAANFCYRRIPLDPARQARCDAFDAGARSFDPNNAAALGELFDKCYLLARTGEEMNWSRTGVCQLFLDSGDTVELKNCLNSTFALSPELKISVATPSPDAQ
jgi:hypothetical protein